MSRDPWFPFFPMDYLADPVVLCMTLEEQGAYVRLLCHAWHPPMWQGQACQRGYLPNDPQLLAAMSGAGSMDRWGELSAHVLLAFGTTEDGQFIYQKRMLKESEHVERIRQARSVAGKCSANVRQMLNKCSTKPQQKSTNHTVTVTRKEEAVPGGTGSSVPGLLKRLDALSGGAFVYSKPTKGQVIAIQRAMTESGEVDWENLAEYLKANHSGRGGEPLGVPLLASVLCDRVAKARRWKAAGMPPLTRGGESFEAARRRKIAEEEARRPDLQPFVPPVPSEN